MGVTGFMKLMRIAVPLLCLGLLAWGYRQFGWPGVAGVTGGLIMWLLLHFTRAMAVMRRAAQRPIGHVDSAVMLNARLRAGVSLLHVVGMTRALGQLRSPEGQQPEIYRWTDAGHSWVEAEFSGGKLQRWRMERPAEQAGDGADAAP